MHFMNLKNWLFVAFTVFAFQEYAYAQPALTNKLVDTEPIELYLELTTSIKKEGKANKSVVAKYFNNPAIAFFRQNPDFDSLRFINNLVFVYSGAVNDSTLLTKNEEYHLMMKYKANEVIIRKSIKKLKKANINALVKKRLQTFYDKSFNIDTVSIHYIYLFLDEGNGGYPGHVFNSALQTAYLDNDIIYLVSAHEAYHTVTNSIFMSKFAHVLNDVGANTVQSNQNLLWYLEIVAEEGIADLIDKPTLRQRKSPLSKDFKKLSSNDDEKSSRKIVLLDSLLNNSKLTGNQNFLSINNLLENGGHIPGRYMALKIKENGLLGDYLKHTGNPFQFIYNYNDAVGKSTYAPKFSEKSIQYLKELEQSLMMSRKSK